MAAATRPYGGLERLVGAVAGVFAPRETLSFDAVEGVFQAAAVEANGGETGMVRRPVSSAAPAARLYDRRAQEVIAYVAPRGRMLSVRG